MASMIMNRTWSLSNRERQAGRRLVRVICPIDFTARDLVAVRYAAQLARQRRGKLIVVHVVPPDATTDFNESDETRNSRCEVALAQLEEYVPQPSGVECEWVVLQGDVPGQLIEFASGSDRPQIVMATRGRKADCSILGVTTETVLRQATCPVVIVNEDDLDTRHPGVGTDQFVCA